MDKKKIYPRSNDNQTVYLKSVVTRPTIEVDVEPYSIVGGVPAKEIRKRFAPEVIKKLMEIQWWNWPIEKIRSSIPDIQSGNSSGAIKILPLLLKY